MSFHNWLEHLRSTLTPGRDQRHTPRRGALRARTQRPHVEVLEDRCVPAQYAVTDLGTLGGNYSTAYDVNEVGQVAGYATTADGSDHAFLWDNGTMIDLGTLGGNYSVATAINDLGQVVGYSRRPGSESFQAFVVTPQGGMWFQDSDLDGRNDFMVDLGTMDGSIGSWASDINNAGQVILNSAGRAFLWDPVSGMADLGVPLGFTYCAALGINEAGQVTGYAYSESHRSAFLWDAAHGMTVLGAGPGYFESWAVGINDAGQVVGAQWGAAEAHAFLWTPDSPNGLTGAFTDLGTFPGGNWSEAVALNNAGQVVGLSNGPEICDEEGCWRMEDMFIWSAADGMLDLQGLLPTGSRATAINDDGVIAVYVNGWGENRAYLLTPIPPGTPTISIPNPAAVMEGNGGTVAATFTVALSAASTETVTVAYTTGNGTATAGSDYQAVSGTLTFAPGETSKTITVLVNGDRLGEPNETFFVNLSSPTNAIIANGQGVGTITDDEPRISIRDVTGSEGRRRKTTLFTFTVTLSAAYDQAVTMSFQTVNGTATTSDNDYIAQTGTLTFAPGETTKTITIEVKGDSKKEANETFYLDLFGLSGNALFTKNRGLGTILNDD